jgi:hypothetical protein
VDDFFELRFGIPNSYAKFAAMAATVLTVVFGSGRGWRCAERLRETRPWPRIGILLVNWLGATGLALVIPMFVICLMTMASGLPEPLSMIDWLFFLLTPLLLLLPGFIVERRIRKSELENPVPSQTIVDGKMKVETFVTLIVAAPLTWIIVPIILRIVNRLCKRRAFAPVAIDNLTPAARDYFDRMQLELARLGFELSCYSAHSAIVNNEMIHVGCWRHAGERISAVATITELCVNTIASVNHAVVMTSKCQSGEIASTHGALVPAFCKTGDEGYTISLCGEKELERYLIVHRALLAHCSQEPVWSRADETMSIEQQTAHELNDASQREMELMEKHRLCYLRRDGTAYQFTWKGAIFIGLCSVFPFLQLRQRAYKQRMQKRLAEIGVRY